MEELIFFGIIIVFSILESLARSRRAKAKRDTDEVEPEQFEWAQKAPWEDDLPAYDDDPSYDDAAEAGAPEPARGEAPHGVSGALGEDRLPTAEELLAELTGAAKRRREEQPGRELSRRSPPPRPASPSPRQSPPLPRRSAPPPRHSPPLPPSTSPIRRGSIARTEDEAYESEIRGGGLVRSAHEVHLSHAGYGTDPSERAASVVPTYGDEPRSATAIGVREELRTGRDALRRAIVLKEVLGPPVSMRDD